MKILAHDDVLELIGFLSHFVVTIGIDCRRQFRIKYYVLLLQRFQNFEKLYFFFFIIIFRREVGGQKTISRNLHVILFISGRYIRVISPR